MQMEMSESDEGEGAVECRKPRLQSEIDESSMLDLNREDSVISNISQATVLINSLMQKPDYQALLQCKRALDLDSEQEQE